MPNHPHDRSANYTGRRQAIEMLIFQIDKLFVVRLCGSQIYLIYPMACGKGYDSLADSEIQGLAR